MKKKRNKNNDQELLLKNTDQLADRGLELTKELEKLMKKNPDAEDRKEIFDELESLMSILKRKTT